MGDILQITHQLVSIPKFSFKKCVPFFKYFFYFFKDDTESSVTENKEAEVCETEERMDKHEEELGITYIYYGHIECDCSFLCHELLTQNIFNEY